MDGLDWTNFDKFKNLITLFKIFKIKLYFHNKF